jgi:hypothetical protein
MQERRRHVRAKPVPELPARVLYEVAPTITEALDVVDISVSGLAVAVVQEMKLDATAVGLKLKLVLPDATHPLEGRVRWKDHGMVGIELVDPPADITKAIQRYVGELLERGSAA